MAERSKVNAPAYQLFDLNALMQQNMQGMPDAVARGYGASQIINANKLREQQQQQLGGYTSALDRANQQVMQEAMMDRNFDYSTELLKQHSDLAGKNRATLPPQIAAQMGTGAAAGHDTASLEQAFANVFKTGGEGTKAFREGGVGIEQPWMFGMRNLPGVGAAPVQAVEPTGIAAGRAANPAVTTVDMSGFDAGGNLLKGQGKALASESPATATSRVQTAIGEAGRATPTSGTTNINKAGVGPKAWAAIEKYTAAGYDVNRISGDASHSIVTISKPGQPAKYFVIRADGSVAQVR